MRLPSHTMAAGFEIFTMKLTIYNVAIGFFLLNAVPVCSQQATRGIADKNFFTGKDLKGWSASAMHYWSVRDGAIMGHAESTVQKNEFLWSDVPVKDFYLSVDVLLQPADRNAGIQFRSTKADADGQAKGYQADVGMGVWGKLYHEHGRGKLDWNSQGEKAVKEGDWNHYEILAVGHRIWTAINGTLATAVEDTGGELSGYIALQIHSGPSQTVKYRINKLVHNPAISLAGLSEEQLVGKLQAPLSRVKGMNTLQTKENGLIGFAGGINIVKMRY